MLSVQQPQVWAIGFVVATRQASTQHVEIFDLQTKKFVKLQQMCIITTLLFLHPQMKSGTTV
jgi:hypothetical protein